MALTLDPSTPAAVYASSGNAVTATFTAPANTVVVALAALQSTAAGGSINPSVLDSGGLAWLTIGRLPGTGTTGEVVAWASIPKTTVSRTVTVTGVADNTRAKYVQTLVFQGADLSSTFPTVVSGSAAAGNSWGGSTNTSDTSAYPNSVLMPAPIAIPSGAVRIPAGSVSNITTAINNNANGTVFVLDAGTYSGGGGTQVFPKAGQQFYGQGAGVTVCSNVWWHRQDSSRTGVGIFNMTVKDCGSQSGAFSGHYAAIDCNFHESSAASGWHIAGCEITNNYMGISLGLNGLVEHCSIHHNGGKGMAGMMTGSELRYCQLYFNCTPGANNYYDTGADDSGVKFTVMNGAYIHHNLFSHANGASTSRNYGGIGGHGIWQDVSCGINSADRTGNYPSSGNRYDSNIIYSNNSGGICDETGGNNQFTNNIIANNAHGVSLDGFRQAGISIQSSNHDVATGNYIWNNPHSVIVYMDQNGGDRSDAGRSKNNTVTGNTLDSAPVEQTGTWSGGSGNNNFSGNTIVAGFAGVTVPKIKAGPQTAGGSSTGLMTAALTASRTGSQMWAIYADAAGGAAPTPGSGVTRYSAGVGATTGAALLRAATGVAGNPMAITTTAPPGPLSWLAFEIVPATGGGGTSSSGTVSSTGVIAGGRGTKKVSGSGHVVGVGAVTTPAGGSGTITIDTTNTPARVSTVSLGSGDVTTALFTAQAGTVLVAEGALSSWSGGGTVIPSVSDTSGLTWTQAALTLPVGPQEQSGLWYTVVPTTRSLRVTLTAVHNGSAKSLQVIPFLGVDTTAPVSATGVGSSTGTPTATATATVAGAVLVAGATEYYGHGPATVGPGTLVSQVQLNMTDVAMVSAPASASGATLTVKATASGSPQSWVDAWLVLKPAAGTPYSLITGIGAIAAAGAKRGLGAGTIVGSGTIAGRPFEGGAIYAVGNMDLSRVDLRVTWTGGSVTNVDIVRTDATGTVVPVRGGTNAALVSGQWIGADYEAPLDTTLHYQVTPHDGGSAVISQAVVLGSGGAYWLKSPGRPALNLRVFPAEDHATKKTRDLPQGVFKILNRDDPIIRSMRRWKPTAVLKFLTTSNADRVAFETLLDDGQTLLYQTPATDAAGSDAGYVGVAAYDVDRIGYLIDDRLFTLNVIYTGRPSGLASPVGPGSSTGGGDSSGGVFGGVWADVLAHYQGWADVETAKGSWADLETNIAAAAAPGTL